MIRQELWDEMVELSYKDDSKYAYACLAGRMRVMLSDEQADWMLEVMRRKHGGVA